MAEQIQNPMPNDAPGQGAGIRPVVNRIQGLLKNIVAEILVQ